MLQNYERKDDDRCCRITIKKTTDVSEFQQKIRSMLRNYKRENDRCCGITTENKTDVVELQQKRRLILPNYNTKDD